MTSEPTPSANETMRSAIGRVAFNEYRTRVGGLSQRDSQPIPEWDELPESTKDAWGHAAMGVIARLHDDKIIETYQMVKKMHDLVETVMQSPMAGMMPPGMMPPGGMTGLVVPTGKGGKRA
jgi:hypothetical protein